MIKASSVGGGGPDYALLSGDPSFSRLLYQRVDAKEIAFWGQSLVSLHYAHVSIIGLQLKVEQVWGDDGLYLVQGRPPRMTL